MILVFSSTTEGFVSFFNSSHANQKSRLSSLYSDRRNSRKTSRPSSERSIISKLRDHDSTSSRLGCLRFEHIDRHKINTETRSDTGGRTGCTYCSSAASILSILVQVCRSLLSILSSFLNKRQEMIIPAKIKAWACFRKVKKTHLSCTSWEQVKVISKYLFFWLPSTFTSTSWRNIHHFYCMKLFW